MNHLDIVWTNQFKKDYKLAMKRHLNIELLDDSFFFSLSFSFFCTSSSFNAVSSNSAFAAANS